MTDEPLPPMRPLDDVLEEAHVTLHAFIEKVNAGGKGYGSALAQAIYAQLDIALKLWLILYDEDDEPDRPELVH
jgi:hypothetical protein